jgi:RNA polymerase sigma-32 factor
MRPDQVETIAKRLGVTGQDVIDMNRRFGGDASLDAPIRDDGDSGEWQDWLVDERENQETTLAESEELDHRRKALTAALLVLNDRERRIFEARRLADDPITLAELAEEFGVSRERVRQIEVRAFEKVKKVVLARASANGQSRSFQQHSARMQVSKSRSSQNGAKQLSFRDVGSLHRALQFQKPSNAQPGATLAWG